MDVVSNLLNAIRSIPDFPKSGILFKDITPILGNADLLNQAVDLLAKPYESRGITKVVGVESRGFILGPMLALKLDAGFVPVRKKGKLPFETHHIEYDLEYGKDIIEMHIDAVKPVDRVLIHDDLIATGGTANATEKLVSRSGADLVGFSFLVELVALNGRERLRDGVAVNVVLSV